MLPPPTVTRGQDVKRAITPDIKEAKIIIAEILEADENYRRELGAFGANDKRTQLRKYMFEGRMCTLRWWFNSRFPRD